MPHHFYRVEASSPNLAKEYWEVRIVRLEEENGEPVEGSTVVLTLPRELLFAHNAKTQRPDVERLQGCLLKELEYLALEKEPEEKHRG